MTSETPTPVARVVAAACRIGGITLSLPRPARHHTIMHAAHYAGMPGPILTDDQGFLDDRGEFLSREQAWSVAVAAGQPFVGKPPRPGCLFSEDLW